MMPKYRSIPKKYVILEEKAVARLGQSERMVASFGRLSVISSWLGT